MGDHTPTPTRRPDLMLVHPRLHNPSPANATTFLRWTKLHFRDLLNIPEYATLGRVARTLRFTAPDNDNRYSHVDGEGLSKYTYTCVVDDIGILQTQAYYDVCRALNLEDTRKLGKEEEKVGYEEEGKMVFDVVDAKFAVFAEVASGK